MNPRTGFFLTVALLLAMLAVMAANAMMTRATAAVTATMAQAGGAR
jgi:hypothetical protein